MKVSVVIPAYNAARFIPRCLQSVFAQTRQPDEIIVVDDGSSDETASLAASLGATVIRQKNGGVASARNAAIAQAKNEWIGLLDADDMWAPEKLERQIGQIDSDTVLVYSGLQNFDDNGMREVIPAFDPIQARKMIRYFNPVPNSSVLVRRQAILNAGGFRKECSPCEDWEMWARLQQVGKFKVVASPLLLYYVYPGSLSARPERMLHALDQFIDTTLLEGLHGVDRWAWRRRIRAVQLGCAGLIARENGLKEELSYMLQSVYEWPSPFWRRQRFAALAVTAKNRLGRKNAALRADGLQQPSKP
jgi:glycosyltransferase involved in cell wall biosynthesis